MLSLLQQRWPIEHHADRRSSRSSIEWHFDQEALAVGSGLRSSNHVRARRKGQPLRDATLESCTGCVHRRRKNLRSTWSRVEDDLPVDAPLWPTTQPTSLAALIRCLLGSLQAHRFPAQPLSDWADSRTRALRRHGAAGASRTPTRTRSSGLTPEGFATTVEGREQARIQSAFRASLGSMPAALRAGK